MKISRRQLMKTSIGAAAAIAAPRALISASLGAPSVINVFMGTTPDFANVWIAKLNGFFEREGLPNVEIRLFPSGAAASDAFRTGEAHFLGCGDLPAIRMWKTIGSRCIAPISRDFNFNVVVVKSDIKTPADLKGKTIATQTGSALIFMVELINRKYDLKDGDYRLVNMEPTDMVIALAQGSIDGFVWSSPFDEKAKEIAGDKVHVLLRGVDVNYPNSVTLSVRKELIQSDHNTVQRFINGLAKASDWCMENKDEAHRIVGKQLRLSPQAPSTIINTNFRINFDQALYAYYYNLGRYMLGKGLVDAPINWDEYLDTEFIKGVDATRVEKMAASY